MYSSLGSLYGISTNERLSIRNIIVAFIAVLVITTIQNVTGYPPPQPVQAESNKTIVEAPKKPKTPKVVKSAPKKEKPVKQAPKPPVVVSQGVPKPVTVPSGSCSDWIRAAGISDVASATELIRRESGCNPNAINPSSGACGVAQELPCGKSGCSLGDGACQVKWMSSYVASRYGSWAGAVAFHNANSWY